MNIYLCKQKCGAARLKTDEPDILEITDPDYDWEESVCGKVEEELPADDPESLGKCTVTVRYHDNNLHLSFITGRPVTRFLYFASKTTV